MDLIVHSCCPHVDDLLRSFPHKLLSGANGSTWKRTPGCVGLQQKMLNQAHFINFQRKQGVFLPETNTKRTWELMLGRWTASPPNFGAAVSAYFHGRTLCFRERTPSSNIHRNFASFTWHSRRDFFQKISDVRCAAWSFCWRETPRMPPSPVEVCSFLLSSNP